MKRSIPRLSLGSMGVSLSKVATMMVLLLSGFQATAQVDCTTTMACNDGVQVSLDESCEAVIVPDMMLEDPAYDDSEYTVTVRLLDGTIVPNATVNFSHVNQNLEVQVTLTDCGNSCWGLIRVEDKLPPVILQCLDYEVDCDDNVLPGQGVVPLPTASDACGAISALDYIDVETVLPCTAPFVKQIVRTWSVFDLQGNEANCTQTINVLRTNVATITFPPDYDDLPGNEPAFYCGDILDLLPSGAPSPDQTGRPAGANCPNIQTYYEDVIFNICGTSIKVLRKWLVVDWCTGQERTENQIIKILDDVAPLSPSTPGVDVVVIPTDPELCTATFDVPDPVVEFDCSAVTYTVAYKLRDENGQPFVDPITTNVRPNGPGKYKILDLPTDTTWVIYTLTDACGNVSQSFIEVLVEDNEAPNPVCEGYTVVGLEDEGWADVYATSIDDGSFDNCGIDRLEIKRLTNACGFTTDLQFGEKVNFCCNDIGNGYVKVVMRAYDAGGRFNDCIVNVTVQDKINPTIVCPADIQIDCEDDFDDLNLVGEATAEDNCSVVVTYADNKILNDCGIGVIQRTWTATDPQGLKADCLQTITVGVDSPFTESDISWPADREVQGCDASGVSPETLNSRPVVNGQNCINVAISYDDDVFYSVPDYCIKVVRHWKVTDWCSYDPQSPNYFTYTQKIGIFNNTAPTITSNCTNKTIEAEIGQCDATISETVEATDDCTIGALLKYSYTLDLNNNGTIDRTGNTSSINGTYESGTHRLTWFVEDACKNEATCSYLITIKDTKAPTPICLGSVVWVLDPDGTTEVWASDFNLKSEDTCDEDAELSFAFDEAGLFPAMSFTCNDVPNGISAEIPLQMYVFDTDGNFEFCDVILMLQDNGNNACLDMPGAQGRIQGMITTPSQEGINNIEVELQNMDSQIATMGMTTVGEYEFDAITYYDEYSVVPTKNDDLKNGVNTLDLVKIQRHILGLEFITDPYILIAADINNDERITPADLLSLRKAILGVSNEFPNNNSWRFVPSDYEFENELDPYGFPEKINIEEFYFNTTANFTAVKVGDINGSVELADNGLVAPTSTTTIKAVAPNFEAGEIFSVDFRANDLREMVGMQFTLDFDATALGFSTISGGVLAINDDNTALQQASEGLIALSWNDVNSLNLNADDVLFSISFKAKQGGDLADFLTLNSKLVGAESYGNELQTEALELEVSRDAGVDKNELATNKLYQNTPNPFNAITTVRFDLVAASNVTLTVYDVAGRIVDLKKSYYEAGMHSVELNLADKFDSEGVLYYSLETSDYQATRKMVIIK